jgi:hypothetical protein
MKRVPPVAEGSFAVLDNVRRRIRWIVACSGASLSLAVLLLGMMAAGWLDWWLRIDDVGVRVLLALAVWGVAGMTCWRFLWGPLRTSLSDVFLAEQIERRYPGLGGCLSSAMAFRQAQCAAEIGSPELQRRIIAQAERELQHVDATQIVTARPVRSLVLTGMISCTLAALCLLAYPGESATAVRRLVWPWGHHPWPQTTVLQLVRPDGSLVLWDSAEPWRMVRGDILELFVENARGRLPEQVWLETRLSAETVPTRELLPKSPASSRAARDRAALNLTAIRGPIDFRVTGGDDHSMPWHTLEVIDPPTIHHYEIEITPPEYTRQAPAVLAAGSTEIRGWLGSRVRISASASRPLRSVTLQGRDRPPQPLPLSDDGRRWTAQFLIEKPDSTAVWFQLRDREGFTEREPLQFDVRGDIDALPAVTLVAPASDQVVTPDAQVPVEIDARDDLGVRELRLVWQRREEPQQSAPIFQYVEPQAAVHETFSWNLADLELSPGDRVSFRVEARDACTIGPEHVAKSAPRTLIVASPIEKRAELQARASELLEELKEAAALQSRLREQTVELHSQLATTGGLRPPDRDLLQRLELDQRNLSSRLSGGAASLAEQAERLRAEFQSNHLADPDTETGLEQLSQQLRELTRTTMPQLAHELTQAGKLLSADNPAAPSADPPEPQPAARSPESEAAAQSLELAARHQTDVIDTLNELESLLAEWRGQRDVGRALMELAREQQALLNATAEVGAQTVAKSAAELSPQQRADLARLSARQRRQAERIQQLEEQLQQLAQEWRAQDEAAAQAAADAAQELQSAQTQAHARQAAQDIAANRIGPAGALQRAVQETLTALQREWSEQEPDDTKQFVKELQGLADQAASLADQHEQLRKRIDNPDVPSAELALRAAELRRQAQRLTRQLERLRLRRTAEHARNAAEHLRRLERAAADDDDVDQLRQEHAQAGEELEELQRQLQQDRRSAEERLAREEFERIARALAALLQRQKSAIAETQRLEQERLARGQWTRGQLRSLKDLADVERNLAEETQSLAKTFEPAAALKAALTRIGASLQRAADRLAERLTDEVTLRWQRDAERRLEQLIAAWRQPEPEAPSPNPSAPPDDASRGETAEPPGESIPLHVQLHLLRNWQADCLERTARWHAAHPDGTNLSDEDQSELDQLADEQGELARLAQDLADRLSAARAAAAPSEPSTP